MSVMDKFLNAMKLNDEEDEYYDDYYDDEPEPVKKAAPVREESNPDEERIIRKPAAKVTPQAHYSGGCQGNYRDIAGKQDRSSQSGGTGCGHCTADY